VRAPNTGSHVLTEIKNRGTKDCCILVCDGLSGLADAVGQIWPATIVQTCIVRYADVRVMPTWERFVLVREGSALRMSA
jgi:transposase-like protein